MYKCCWNCINGYTVCAKTKEEQERINASKRMCCADYPVSNRLQNPFQQRYCRQFEKDFRVKKGHFIDKKEAEKLKAMTPDELVQYWGEGRMTLKEIAKAFDMSVDDFAKCIGYTRQSLYDKTSVRKTARAKAAISFLRFLNDSMRQQETESVNKRFFARKEAIEAFRQLLLKED